MQRVIFLYDLRHDNTENAVLRLSGLSSLCGGDWEGGDYIR